ncbi:uncharacterized protein [Lepeophtheirus salmonis]|uniref:Putative LOC100899549 [Metaseiulus occidentalis] n=1 Tax=Lepeophtheirus salmonis TaxID=72036 RepID=A0A0K2UKU3_LEPSM|nr:uncharacterized protein LOC121126077 [Lepeophtheirus salmonis]XP_040577303.1 uncharacterized protein LOC121126077 [Lepeophtheirus salmonis]
MLKRESPFVWIINHGGHEIWNYLEDEERMMCRLCNYVCAFRPPSRIKRHLLSSTHIQSVDIFRKHVINNDVEINNIYTDLTKMLVTCNIPLTTVEHPNFSKFVEKYVGKKVPSRKTMSRLVNGVSKDVISQIKKDVEGKDLFIAVDETKEKQDQSISAIMIGPMDSYYLTQPYLVNLTDITLDYANDIADFVIQSIQITLGEDFDESRLKVLITDGTPCSKRAGEDLQRLYPQLEHITCVPEEPNITTELALNDFPSTNNLKAELKKTFSKTGESKQGFLTMMEAVHTQSRSCLTVNSLKDLLIVKWNSKFTDL